jgi:uncharacterized membrane protein YdjX (TVP38/TMEM64 family)
MTWLKRILGALGLAALAFALWSVWDRDAMEAWKLEAGPLPFFGSMALLPAIGLPITPFFVLAGATFGVGPGLLGSGAALGLNLALCYAIARSGLRSRLEAVLRRFEYELPDFEQAEKGALRFTLFVKLTPGAPAFAKNYLLGLTGVPFWLYFGSSMVLTGGYGALCIVLGVSLFEHDVRHLMLAVAVAVALGLGFWWWSRRSARARQAGGTSIARSGACARAAADSLARPHAGTRFERDARG